MKQKTKNGKHGSKNEQVFRKLRIGLQLLKKLSPDFASNIKQI